ncbi:MAG: hypothetical protein JWP31_671 [Aeromicrobium sp.]|nr:hypothetical protein [Aeromicrobium sp.]
MTSEMIEITTPGGRAEAYVTRPDTGEHPGVLFYIDAIGLRPRTKEMADRIAGWGYVVLAPNIFHRDGTAAELEPTVDLREAGHREAFIGGAMARVKAHTPEVSDADLDAYVDTLLGLPAVHGTDIGVTGYCIGGRLAVQAAGRRPDVVAAAAAFHSGGLVTDGGDSPHLRLGTARAEVLAGHADHDRSNPAEAIATFEQALEAHGLTYTSAVYPDAPHGFTMADSSSYDEAAAERHFAELEALLARTLR